MLVLLVGLLLFQFSNGGLDPNEQAILENFYNSLSNTGTLGWTIGNDLCSQSGVYCTSRAFSIRTVTQLDLTNEGLIGTIPTEFEGLTSLEYLYMNENQFSGTIPTELGSLSNLKILYLSDNQITGTLPTELVNLAGLQVLAIRNNQITGAILSSLLTLSNLTDLYFRDNYWDCPVFNYSSVFNNDYTTTKKRCDASCSPNPCSNGKQCSTRLNGDYNCGCSPGYYGGDCETAVYCSAITNEGNAKWDETFANGKVVNGSCINGYLGVVSRTCTQSISNGIWGSISGSCDDLNECLTNNGGCHIDALCENTLGSFNCTCKPGYSGNGFTCEDIDECGLEYGNCNVDAKCTNTPGSFSCACIEGYDGDGFNCTDIDECLENNGGCDTQANCTNTIGSYECHCNQGYYGNGIECSLCPENYYSFNDTACISCPEDTTSSPGSISILDCKCNSFNHYLDNQTSTCLPCDYGFLLDNDSNTCQKIKCPTLSLNGSTFLSTEVNEIAYSDCSLNYFVFESTLPYLPIQDEKGEAICLLNVDNITASWNIIQLCEPSCTIRECNNNQHCVTPPGGGMPPRCNCAGYIGKYCESTDPEGCIDLSCLNNGKCIDKTETKAAYCKCDGTGYSGGFCEEDINECLTNNGGCNLNANCANTPGSFNCVCKEGYNGDGLNCNPSKNEKSESNQGTGIGVGVTFGLLALIGLVLLVLFFLRRKGTKNRESDHVDLESISSLTIIAGDQTLNTKFELSMPGFMNIDFVNQIRKEEKIGGGGAAVIYKGVIIDPKLREKFGFKDVAIKQLVDDQNVSTEENKLRFEQEVSIIWGISSHPNTITLVGYSENPPYIITKLYDEDLHKYIHNTKEDIPSEIILKLGKDIASGMSLVHSTGIVHRDLKPSNILLENENGKMKAIICDFGLARISSEKKMLNQKIVDVKGFSPRYTAPEVFGRMSTNANIIMIEEEMRSDVYSYSLIVWEMMTRKIPWSNLKETAEIDFQVRSGKREPIPDCKGDEILELLSSIIELSWKQVPIERPTFNQIYQKLSSYI